MPIIFLLGLIGANVVVLLGLCIAQVWEKADTIWILRQAFDEGRRLRARSIATPGGIMGL
jgi:hypothetical protein